MATDAVRVVLATAAVALETAMVVQGSRPDAELAGLLVPLGLTAGAVTLPYLVVAVLALVALARRGRGGVGQTLGLAVVDVVVGVGMLLALARAVLVGDTWARSPLLWGIAPLALGVVTFTLARTAPRPAVVS